jgi:hypothetical protein
MRTDLLPDKELLASTLGVVGIPINKATDEINSAKI